MKLTIELSTADVLEIIKGLQIDELVITALTTTPKTQPTITITDHFIGKYDESLWDRRDSRKRALNVEEVRLGRYLTEEEEARIEATLEVQKEDKEKIKDITKRQIQAEKLAAQLTNEVEAEHATAEESPEPFEPSTGKSIPAVAELSSIASLFS